MDAYVQKVVPKTLDQQMRILDKLKDNFLFQGLDYEQQKNIIDAMTEKVVAPGDFVIRQGMHVHGVLLYDGGWPV